MSSDYKFQKYVIPEDGDNRFEERFKSSSLFELFHVNSKNDSSTLGREIEKDLLDDLRAEPRWKGGRRHSLPTNEEDNLSKALSNRSSTRRFQQYNLSQKEIAVLLEKSVGVRTVKGNVVYKRYPSAGALYPVDTYWLNLSNNSIDRGAWRYVPSEHALEKISPEPDVGELFLPGINKEINLDKISGFVVFTGNPWQSAYKYGERGYRYMMLECGHMAQNIAIIAQTLDLDTIMLGGFYDRKLDEYLNLDGVESSTLYMIGVGNGAD